jgi:hypothetical protein
MRPNCSSFFYLPDGHTHKHSETTPDLSSYCNCQAKAGDWVIGTRSKSNVGNNKLIYAMKITEKLLFDACSQDPRFCQKFPSRGLVEERGNNLYHKSKRGAGVQVRRYRHKEEQISHDLGGAYVLISDYLFYFCRKAGRLQTGTKN